MGLEVILGSLMRPYRQELASLVKKTCLFSRPTGVQLVVFFYCSIPVVYLTPQGSPGV